MIKSSLEIKLSNHQDAAAKLAARYMSSSTESSFSSRALC